MDKVDDGYLSVKEKRVVKRAGPGTREDEAGAGDDILFLEASIPASIFEAGFLVSQQVDRDVCHFMHTFCLRDITS